MRTENFGMSLLSVGVLLACSPADNGDSKMSVSTSEVARQGTTEKSVASSVYNDRLECAATLTLAAFIAKEAEMDIDGASAASSAWEKAVLAGESVGFTKERVETDIKEASQKRIASFGKIDPKNEFDKLTAEISDCG